MLLTALFISTTSDQAWMAWTFDHEIQWMLLSSWAGSSSNTQVPGLGLESNITFFNDFLEHAHYSAIPVPTQHLQFDCVVLPDPKVELLLFRCNSLMRITMCLVMKGVSFSDLLTVSSSEETLMQTSVFVTSPAM